MHGFPMPQARHFCNFARMDQDECIAEIPVVVEQGELLYLVQYPLRNKGRPYGQEDQVQWKIQHKCLQVQYPISTNHNYDHKAMFKMEKLTLRSRGLVGGNAPMNLAVGEFIEGKVFRLRPVEGVLQMYPRFDHVDEVVKKEAILDLEIEQDENDDDEEEAKKANEPKRVLAKAKKIKSNEVSERPSWGRIQREFTQDPWIPLRVFGKQQDRMEEEDLSINGI